MQLFQRVKYIVINDSISQAEVARKLGIKPQMFNSWLNEKSQKNLYPHIPKILEIYKKVSELWLYSGKGEPYLDQKIEPTVDNSFSQIQFEKEERLRLEEKITGLIKENARLSYKLEEFELKQSKQAS